MGLDFNTTIPDFVYIAGLVYIGMLFVMYAVASTRFSRWRCPRCGKIFAGTWWYNRGFLVRNCSHCGLPKYAGSRP